MHNKFGDNYLLSPENKFSMEYHNKIFNFKFCFDGDISEFVID